MKAYKYNGLIYPGPHQHNTLSKLRMYITNTLVGMHVFYCISLEPHSSAYPLQLSPINTVTCRYSIYTYRRHFMKEALYNTFI